MHGYKREIGNKAPHAKALRPAGAGNAPVVCLVSRPNGTARRERFTKDRKESEQLYRRWVVEHYDDAAHIVTRDGTGFKGDLGRTLPDEGDRPYCAAQAWPDDHGFCVETMTGMSKKGVQHLVRLSEDLVLGDATARVARHLIQSDTTKGGGEFTLPCGSATSRAPAI